MTVSGNTPPKTCRRGGGVTGNQWAIIWEKSWLIGFGHCRWRGPPLPEEREVKDTLTSLPPIVCASHWLNPAEAHWCSPYRPAFCVQSGVKLARSGFEGANGRAFCMAKLRVQGKAQEFFSSVFPAMQWLCDRFKLTDGKKYLLCTCTRSASDIAFGRLSSILSSCWILLTGKVLHF